MIQSKTDFCEHITFCETFFVTVRAPDPYAPNLV